MHRSISDLLLVQLLTLLHPPGHDRDERGDVPGWVMVTVMSAAVVAAMLPFVRDELMAMLRAAFASVTS